MKRKSTIKAILGDWFAALLAWAAFYIFRKLKVEAVSYGFIEVLNDKKFLFGVLVIPVCWILLYAMVGYIILPIIARLQHWLIMLAAHYY